MYKGKKPRQTRNLHQPPKQHKNNLVHKTTSNSPTFLFKEKKNKKSINLMRKIQQTDTLDAALSFGRCGIARPCLPSLSKASEAIFESQLKEVRQVVLGSLRDFFLDLVGILWSVGFFLGSFKPSFDIASAHR